MPDDSAWEHPFFILDEVGSTNNYAMARISEAPVAEGTIYFAQNQVAGKGQRGKQWASTPGQNITMSMVLKPYHLQLSEQFLLSAVVALGSYDFVKKYAGPTTRIKWSNDLYWNDKKTGGILIENVVRGKVWNYAIAGIGINVNQQIFDPALPNPASLSQITGCRFNVVSLAKELGRSILQRYKVLQPQHFNDILEAYNQVLYRRNQRARYRMGNEVFEATILRAEKSGRLILEKGDNQLSAHFGEISFVTE